MTQTAITLTDDRINLNNDRIIGFEGETPDGEHYSEATINLESLQLQTLDETVRGTYRVIANAILHRADLASLDIIKSGDIERKRGILYNGSIAIYGPKEFTNERETTEDYRLLVNGRIWLARPDKRDKQTTLKEIILGTNPTPKRVKKIIEEYEAQDKAEKERIESALIESHDSGKEHQVYLDAPRIRSLLTKKLF